MSKTHKTNSRRKDRQLAAAASDALQWLATIPEEAITVTARNGHLDLEGRVHSLEQWLIIKDMARTLRGVQGVSNFICVEANPAFADARAAA